MLFAELVPHLIALLAALSAIGMIVAAFYPRVAKPSVAHARFLTIAAIATVEEAPGGPTDETRRRRAVEATLKEMEDKQKAKRSTGPSLLDRMRQAGLGWSKRTYYTVCAATGGVVLLLGPSVFGLGPLPSGGFSLAGGLLLPHLYVGMRRTRRFRRFTAEFPNAVDIIVRGVKSGLPLADCLKIIATETQEPVRSEFKVIVEDQTLGMPLDEAVQRLAGRMPLPEANFFAIVIAIQSRTGGSLSEALGNLSKVLRDRVKMGAKIKAMSSEAKSSAGIIAALPVAVAGLMYLTAPDYIALLVTTLTGKMVLAASAVWMGAGVLVMRKMINFDF
ncbi:type II secretion system F family protein [Microvirga yunnanensis]|uniref:type II secretion system F family protein n=1 Tax=Microvirga yunnanensis TaxID=2953740 RepID=UPI0021C6F945|nr:type II secretion system F family protein [Microvirga sp. HBU65207]